MHSRGVAHVLILVVILIIGLLFAVALSTTNIVRRESPIDIASESVGGVSVPSNYSECVKIDSAHISDVGHTCSYSTNEGSLAFNECKSVGGNLGRLFVDGVGFGDEYATCELKYIDPSLNIPSSYQECTKFESSTGQKCTFSISKAGINNKDVVQSLFEECLQKGGYNPYIINSNSRSTHECYITFKSGGGPAEPAKPYFSPRCETTPRSVKQGGNLIISVYSNEEFKDFAGKTAEFYVGTELVGKNVIDEQGSVVFGFYTTENTKVGLRFVSVEIEGTAVGASCAVDVVD